MTPRLAIPGYRYFKCEDCLCNWREGCRDCPTQSISDCPKCSETWSPYKHEPNPDINIDGPFIVEVLSTVFDDYEEWMRDQLKNPDDLRTAYYSPDLRVAFIAGVEKAKEEHKKKINNIVKLEAEVSKQADITEADIFHLAESVVNPDGVVNSFLEKLFAEHILIGKIKPAALDVLSEFIKKLDSDCSSNNNHGTAPPILWCLQKKKLDYYPVWNSGGYWTCDECSETIVYANTSEKAIKEFKAKDIDANDENIDEFDQIETWETIQTFLTEDGLKRHVALNSHNLGEYRSYVVHAFRNPELSELYSAIRCLTKEQ